MSEKSVGSNVTDGQEPDSAELLTAWRVWVGQIQVFASMGESSTQGAGVLGLIRLAILGRMS